MGQSENATGTPYQPAFIQLPPLYAWPPRLLGSLRYLLVDMLFPWGLAYLVLAVFIWRYLTPDPVVMSTFSPGWLGFLWLRNCISLLLVAGGLHWWFYIRKAQQRQYKFHAKWLASNSRKFLWGSQVKDNMFWSIVSGVTVWTGFEAVSYWFYATSRVTAPDSVVWFVVSFYLLFFWSTGNFYLVHRILHIKPVYDHVHELHHRNVNVGPWSGIAMHPVEHLFYFSPFALWWIVPVHPVIIVLTGLYQAIYPAFSHSGFDYLRLPFGLRISAGDWFHQLHHQYFNLNFGNTPTPLDHLFGSWHDGSAESLEHQKQLMRERRAGSS